VTSLGTQALGTQLTFSTPTYIVGDKTTGANIAEWANAAMHGRQFIHRPYRDQAQTYRIYALEAATVTVTNNGVEETDSPKTIAAGAYDSVSGDYNLDILRFSSTGNIIMMVSSSTSTTGDLMPVPPAADTIYGSCSSACYVYIFGDDTSGTITEQCSDGTTTSRSNNVAMSNFGSQYTGKACKWIAPTGKLIGGNSAGDGDGGDGTSFLPLAYFATVVPIPVAMEYLYLISYQAATCTAGSTSFTLTGSSSYGVYTIREGSQSAGTVYTCTQPVTALGDESWSEAGDSEEFQIIAVGGTGIYEAVQECTAGTYTAPSYTQTQTPTIDDCGQNARDGNFLCFTYGTQAGDTGVVGSTTYTSDGGRANDCIMTNDCTFVSGWEENCRWHVYASAGTSTALDASYTAYDSDGTVNTLLTNGIYDTDSDIDYNRVNKDTGDELTFDLGASATVHSVRIANGNANWGGTESSNQWTIYSGSSLSGSWTSQGTVTFTATSASQEESVTPFASQYIKMTCDTNHGNGNNCVLRQMGFITR